MVQERFDPGVSDFQLVVVWQGGQQVDAVPQATNPGTNTYTVLYLRPTVLL